MTVILAWIVSAIAVVGGTVLIALPLRTWRQRGVAVCAFLLVAVAAFTLAPSMLSRPKPVELEWAMHETAAAQVVGSQAIEGKGIYLLLRLPAIEEPRYYVMPWSMELAQQLQDAQQQMAAGDGLMLEVPFAQSWDPDPPRFYPLPQPRLPDKGGENAPEQPEGGGA